MKHRHIHTRRISCAEIYAHVCDNLDSKLDSEECRRLKAHIAECRNCTALLDSLKKTVTLYRKYPTPTLSTKATTELLAVIHARKGKAKKKTAR